MTNPTLWTNTINPPTSWGSVTKTPPTSWGSVVDPTLYLLLDDLTFLLLDDGGKMITQV